MLLRRFQVFFLMLLGLTVSYHVLKNTDLVGRCGRQIYYSLYVPHRIERSPLTRPPPILPPFDMRTDPTVLYAFHPIHHVTGRRPRR